MWISTAYAQATEAAGDLAAEQLANAPSPAGAFLESMFLVIILMVLFYVLLILPQQKRFKAHSKMLAEIQKGDEVITGGGLVGKVDKIKDDELVIDLGNNLKVPAVRSTVHTRNSPMLPNGPANDSKGSKDKTGDNDKKKSQKKS